MGKILCFVKGKTIDYNSKEQVSKFGRLRESLEQLVKIFRENGIEPTDLIPDKLPFKQLLAETSENGQIRLHLLDSEMFHRIKI